MRQFICYYHELSADDIQRLCTRQMTYGEIERVFPQPPWCEYPEATRGMMGCWSLIYNMVTGEDYCRHCEESRTRACNCHLNNGEEYFNCCVHGPVNYKRKAIIF
jgi:hypothetical protein